VDNAPARKIAYVVSPDGAVVPYTPPPPPTRVLSREERTCAYREGLRRTSDLLEQMGFRSVYDCEHSYSLRYKGLLLDFRIQKPDLVAHISGQRLPGGKPGRHGGTIYRLSDEIKSEFALMITVGTKSAAPPVFVDLPESLADPAKHIQDAVVGLLAALNERGDRLGAAVRGFELPCGPKQLPEWLE